MKIDKLYFKDEEWLVDDSKECDASAVNIVFVFGYVEILKNHNHTLLLKKIYPNAHIIGVSSAANIMDDGISQYDAIASAISFEKGWVSVNSAVMRADALEEDSSALVDTLEQKDLKHLFVLAQGPNIINGSELVRGLNKNVNVTVSGGLAADKNKFDETYIFLDDNKEKNLTVAIGFYGDDLHIDIGCIAGWEEFGAVRRVTKSKKNVVYEIDDKPALELYERYLGDYIKDLPASGLLFPLSVKTNKNDKNEVIRVMMGINKDNSLSFAGDVEEGAEVRLMKTNIDNLIDGAELVANSIKQYNNKRSLALSVSCSGRLSVLKQLADEEIEVMQNVLGENAQIVGFYSHGEIAPFSNDLLNCKLHNQTITLTTIYED